MLFDNQKTEATRLPSFPSQNVQSIPEQQIQVPSERRPDIRSGRSLDDLEKTSAAIKTSHMVISPSSSVISTPANCPAPPQKSISIPNDQSPNASPSLSAPQQTLYETSFVGKEPRLNPQPTVTTRLSAVPCYYRTLPDNKIQVMYPDSNQVFLFSYSKTVPPISKKSSMQLIQQVQPDGKLSEEKLYFFDPIQLDEADTRMRYHEQIVNQGKVSPRRIGGTPGKKQPWIFKKTIAVKEKMKQTK